MAHTSDTSRSHESTNATSPENELRAALTAFETSVTTPLVSGELPDWIENAQKTWAEASSQAKRHVSELHPRQYEEISQVDPALFHEVEKLKAEDEAIEKSRVKLDQSVERVARHVPGVEPDEGKAEPIIEILTSEGVEFVTRMRKQEVAVQTWFVEAFNRERGGGD